jgi:hypothetical protein
VTTWNNAGAAGCLRYIVGIQSELSILPLYDQMPSYLDTLPRYHALGFDIVGFFDVLRDRRTLNLVECDCVMVRRGAIEAALGRGWP